MTSEPLCRPAIASWFDAEADPRHRALALAICARCPMQLTCLDIGRKERASGIYGGEVLVDGHTPRAPSGLRVAASPTKGRDSRGRPLIECRECGRVRRHSGRALCSGCHKRALATERAGKASTSPDAATVADVKALDIQWAGAIKRVAAARARQRKKRYAYMCAFLDAWEVWTYGSACHKLPLSSSWEASIGRFYDLGVPIEELLDCVTVACGNNRVRPDETFRYFAGCVWRTVKEMQDAAKELLDTKAVADGS